MRLVGIAALFSGVALLAHILTNISLRVGLGVTVLIALGGLYLAFKRSDPEEKKNIIKIALVGTIVGLAATGVYDFAKYILARFDPSPYNPYEAIRVFGSLLVGEGSSLQAQRVAGTLFHFLNGTCFAIAYAFLFKKHGILTGILWGVFLETFQLTLYPGWLDIKFYEEFTRISFFSHIIYGIVLGVGIKYGLHKVRVVQ